MKLENILVPTDFSLHAERALDLAIDLARPHGAKIHLLYCCYVGRYLSGAPEPLGVPAEFLEKLHRDSRIRLYELAQRVESQGLSYRIELADQEPVSMILHCAAALPADLIVMGTQGLTGLKHLLLGSTAERVLRMSPCPVLTVRADAAAQPAREVLAAAEQTPAAAAAAAGTKATAGATSH